MKFLWSTINVNNMEESLAFYREVVGLAVSRSFKTPEGMEIAFLGSEETKVELVYSPDRKAPGNVNGISLGFEVASLDHEMEFVKNKGIEIESGPFQPNPHTSFFYVKDPNGITIQFVENM
jgi:lactoylglutathione lyase